MTEFPDRIPYAHWINSQMSIARFYGGLNLNGSRYIIEKDTNDLVKVIRCKNRKEKKKKSEKKVEKNLSFSL